jgi:hypothetical protein
MLVRRPATASYVDRPLTSDVIRMRTLPPDPALRKRRCPCHQNLTPNIITAVTSASHDYADPQVHRLAPHRVNSLLNRTRLKTAYQHRCLPPPQGFASSQTHRRWNKSLAVLLAFPSGRPPTNPRTRNIASAQNDVRVAACRKTTGSIRHVRMTVHLASHVVRMTHGAT